MKKLPPYGARIRKLLASGKIPKNDIYLFCGKHSWLKAKIFNQSRYVLCLPPNDDPAYYDWPVENCDVLVFDTSGVELLIVEKIAYYLLSAKAAIVRAILSDYTFIIYRRS